LLGLSALGLGVISLLLRTSQQPPTSAGGSVANTARYVSGALLATAGAALIIASPAIHPAFISF
jgi:hypothetical protein